VIGWSDDLRVITCPDGGLLLVCGGTVQGCDELIHFWGHDGNDVDSVRVDGGEGVGGAGRDCDVLALLEDPSLIADEYLETASEDDERLSGPVVLMAWRLIAGVVGQVPPSDHEVTHMGQPIDPTGDVDRGHILS
jgi:hypothetical protein